METYLNKNIIPGAFDVRHLIIQQANVGQENVIPIVLNAINLKKYFS